MNYKLLFSAALIPAGLTLTSCTGQEPANAECDIERAWVHFDNPTSIFFHRADTLAEILPSYASSEIQFPLARHDAEITTAPLFVEITPGAHIYQLINGREEEFRSGSPVDFSDDQQRRFRVRSEDGKNVREYTIFIKHGKAPAISTETLELGSLTINGITVNGNTFSFDNLMDIAPYGEVPVHLEGTRDGDAITFQISIQMSEEKTAYISYENGELRGTWGEDEFIPTKRSYTLEGTTLDLGEFSINTATLIHFNFESAKLDARTSKYYEWTETDPLCEPNIWSTGNPGFQLSQSSATWDAYPSVSEEGGVDGGLCVRLTTCSTGGFGELSKMPIAAGNLFIGKFDIGNAMKNALKATLMGEPLSHKPLYMRGFYKFHPGASKKDRYGNPIEGEEDVCDFYCVVYKNIDAQGNKVQLDGNILDTNPANNPNKDYIVGIARVKGEDIIRDSEGWNTFELPVVYSEEMDRDDVLSQQYNVAVVFSSSIDGAYFKGAIGSTLWIDNVTLVCEY